MSHSLVLIPEKDSQLDIFIQMAKELHIKFRIVNNDFSEINGLSPISELSVKSFSKEWSSPENEHWDNFLK